MRVNNYYKVSNPESGFIPELSPVGTIVRCMSDEGNGFFIIKLFDDCGKNLDCNTWLTNFSYNIFVDCTKEVRKLKLQKINEL